MRIEEGFQLTPTEEPHPYLADLVLPTLLRRLLPENSRTVIHEELVRFGERVSTEIREIGATVAPPTLTQYDHWGQRIDKLHTSEGWKQLKAVAQSEGLPGIYYERDYAEFSRVYGFAKTLMMVGDAQVVFCPLSMTDGCARVLELMGTPDMKSDIYSRLISRDPHEAFTAGQWMTERPGGSDVSQTETVATATASPYSTPPTAPGAKYTLNGFKWFSSATDSNVALALARTGDPGLGSRSLSLFLVPLRIPLFPPSDDVRPSPTSNGVFVHRLKDKFGTKIVPTAELELRDTTAYLISPLNRGVKAITPVLNITRVYCAVDSIGSLRRCFAIARAYSHVRAIYSDHPSSSHHPSPNQLQNQTPSRSLHSVPLHVAELAKISITYRALTHFFFDTVLLLGKTECGVASDAESRRLRLLTPALKAFAAERATAAMEECMAACGGMGYMEEMGIGRMIRDSMVEKIWEGTINVLSLDLVRAASDERTLNAYIEWATKILTSVPVPMSKHLHSPLSVLSSALGLIRRAYETPIPTLMPRPALMLFGHTTSALCLLEHASWSYAEAEAGLTSLYTRAGSASEKSTKVNDHEIDVEVFVRWVEEFGLQKAIRDVEAVWEFGNGKEREWMDSVIVYGSEGGEGSERDSVQGKSRL